MSLLCLTDVNFVHLALHVHRGSADSGFAWTRKPPRRKAAPRINNEELNPKEGHTGRPARRPEITTTVYQTQNWITSRKKASCGACVRRAGRDVLAVCHLLQPAEKIGPGRCRFKRLKSPGEDPHPPTLMWVSLPFRHSHAFLGLIYEAACRTIFEGERSPLGPADHKAGAHLKACSTQTEPDI